MENIKEELEIAFADVARQRREQGANDGHRLEALETGKQNTMADQEPDDAREWRPQHSILGGSTTMLPQAQVEAQARRWWEALDMKTEAQHREVEGQGCEMHLYETNFDIMHT